MDVGTFLEFDRSDSLVMGVEIAGGFGGSSADPAPPAAAMFTPKEQCAPHPALAAGLLQYPQYAGGACGVSGMPSTPAKRVFNGKRGGNSGCNSPSRNTSSLNLLGAADAGSPRKRLRGVGRSLDLAQASSSCCDERIFSCSQESSMSALPPREDSEVLMRAPTAVFTSQYHSTFQEVRDIGTGSYGRVVLAKHLHDNTEYAVKISRRAAISPSDRQAKLREARLLARAVGCPYVVRYFNSWVDEAIVHLQMEFCRFGSVSGVLALSGWRRWPDTLISRLVLNVGCALDYLHRVLKVVHLDVKPDNIFQCAPQDSHPAVPIFKLGDFGIAAKNPERVGLFSQPSVAPATPDMRLCSQQSGLSVASLEDGDARFVAPDMLNGKLFPKEGDIFAFGLALYEVASGLPTPQSGTREWEHVRHEGFLAPKPLVDRDLGYLHPLLTAMVHKQSESRPSAHRVLQANTALWVESGDGAAGAAPCTAPADSCLTASLSERGCGGGAVGGSHLSASDMMGDAHDPRSDVPAWVQPAFFKLTEALQKMDRPPVALQQ